MPDCKTCRGSSKPAKEPRTTGVLSTVVHYVKTKLTSPLCDETLRKRRFAACVSCVEVKIDDKGYPTQEKLSRIVGQDRYCGQPRIEKISRNEGREGCGCDVAEKTRYLDEQCPRGRWGPGANFRSTENIVVPDSGAIHSRIIDLFVRAKKYPKSNNGLGDTVGMLPIVWELQKRAGSNLVVRMRVHPRNIEWALFGWPYIAPEDEINFGHGVAYHYPVEESFMLVDMEAERLGVDRHTIWANRCGIDKLPRTPFYPTIPTDVVAWAKQKVIRAREDGSRIVFLAPWSHHASRTWPLLYWLDLQQRLAAQKVMCFIIDGTEGEKRNAVFPVVRFWGMGPQHTAALFAEADLIVSNDSGMAHFSGLLGHKTLAICGCTNGEVIFKWYGNVESIHIDSPCYGCYFMKERGMKYKCNVGCELLLDLKPAVVFEKVMQMLDQKKKPVVQEEVLIHA